MAILNTKLEKIWTEFTDLLQDEQRDGYPEFFYYYCRHLLDRSIFEKHVLNVQYLFELSNRPITGAHVLDVGCGFGIDCLIMSALGASKLSGIDVNEQWVESIKRYLKQLNWSFPIEPRVADAANLPYEDNTFDFALSVEALSHYRDVDGFLKEAHRVLKPGGTLIISDANNGSNPLISRKTAAIWDRFENGPPAESFHGHRIQKSYRDMRREIITKKFPELNEEAVNQLVDNTFALGGKEIIRAAKKYLKDGILPNSVFKWGVPSFNPVMNDYIERLFEPTKLAKQLKGLGFKVSTYAHFGGAGKTDILGVANLILRLLSPLTIYAARVYKIVAVKQ